MSTITIPENITNKDEALYLISLLQETFVKNKKTADEGIKIRSLSIDDTIFKILCPFNDQEWWRDRNTKNWEYKDGNGRNYFWYNWASDPRLTIRKFNIIYYGQRDNANPAARMLPAYPYDKYSTAGILYQDTCNDWCQGRGYDAYSPNYKLFGTESNRPTYKTENYRGYCGFFPVFEV